MTTKNKRLAAIRRTTVSLPLQPWRLSEQGPGIQPSRLSEQGHTSSGLSLCYGHGSCISVRHDCSLKIHFSPEKLRWHPIITNVEEILQSQLITAQTFHNWGCLGPLSSSVIVPKQPPEAPTAQWFVKCRLLTTYVRIQRASNWILPIVLLDDGRNWVAIDVLVCAELKVINTRLVHWLCVFQSPNRILPTGNWLNQLVFNKCQHFIIETTRTVSVSKNMFTT